MPPSPPAEVRLDAAALRAWPLPDDEHDDKRGRGTTLVIGGSDGTPGAALLAGLAALRTGAGRLQIATAPSVAAPLAVAVPEALVIAHDDADAPALRARIEQATSIVVGPGLDDVDHATALLTAVLEHASPGAIVVVDAKALDALATMATPRRERPIIVTPNREELDRLVDGDTVDDPERAAARRHGVTVASFGRVAAPDGRCWVDDGEVTGLGTSGAGDVLAGAIGGLAARSDDALTAAAWATLAHRLAANHAAADIAPVGYLAREVLDRLPRAVADLVRLVAGEGGYERS